jgi:hypothetical protein
VSRARVGRRAYDRDVAPGDRGRSQRDEPTIDLTRAPQPAEPPVPGAQWDEVRGQWEVWDDAAQAWTVLGDPTGAHVEPLHEVPLLPPDLPLAHEADPAEQHVIDIDRLAAPSEPVPGAQWNEVTGRWERWDDVAGAWVEARADASSG